MFNSRICMACSQEKENLNCKNYYQDCYPTRISMFCNNYKCYIRTLRTWANASFINNQVVFLKVIQRLNCTGYAGIAFYKDTM